MNKLNVVRERCEANLFKANEAIQNAQAEVEKAKAALAKAEERLVSAQSDKVRAEQENIHLVAIAELEVQIEVHQAALQALKSEPAPLMPPGIIASSKQAAQATAELIRPARVSVGTVTTEGGEERRLSSEGVATFKSILGRRHKGMLSPLDGEEAQKLLSALDEQGNVGDRFVVSIKGRKSVRFEVVAEGLKFESV